MERHRIPRWITPVTGCALATTILLTGLPMAHAGAAPATVTRTPPVTATVPSHLGDPWADGHAGPPERLATPSRPGASTAYRTVRRERGEPDLDRHRPHLADSVRMRQSFAEWSLRSAGITWRSSGNCSDRRRRGCTSFEGIRWGSIDGVIAFKERTGCPVVVSGGTERGHAPGRLSHGNGYKIDIMPNRCVDRHIKRHFRPAGTRGDGAKLYRSPGGALYAREDSHWDITYHG